MPKYILLKQWSLQMTCSTPERGESASYTDKLPVGATIFVHMRKGLHRVRSHTKWSRDKGSMTGGINEGLRGECRLKQLTHGSDWSGWLSGRLLWNQPPILRPQHVWLLEVIIGCSATLQGPNPNSPYFYDVHYQLHRFYFQLKHWKPRNTKAWNKSCLIKDNYVRTEQFKDARWTTSC